MFSPTRYLVRQCSSSWVRPRSRRGLSHNQRWQTANPRRPDVITQTTTPTKRLFFVAEILVEPPEKSANVSLSGNKNTDYIRTDPAGTHILFKTALSLPEGKHFMVFFFHLRDESSDVFSALKPLIQLVPLIQLTSLFRKTKPSDLVRNSWILGQYSQNTLKIKTA